MLILNLSKVLFSMLLALSVFGNFQAFAIQINEREFCIDIQTYSLARLNTLLNNRNLRSYLPMKGYSIIEGNLVEELLLADCYYNKNENSFINIILYYGCINYNDHSKSFIEQRELFASKIFDIVLGLCKEFVHEDITRNNIRLVCKSTQIKEQDGNTFFIWEGGDIRYFPKFFDVHL